MHSKMIRGAAALALAAACLSAQAASVTLTDWAFGSGNTVNSTMYKGAAGGFTGSLSGAGAFDSTPFTTYCVELTEFFSFGSTAMTDYNLVSGNSYFGNTKATALGKLMTYVSLNPTQVDTAAESTSLQLAIWNIVYDTDYSVSTASIFRDVSAYAAQANVLLAGAQSVSSSLYNVFALRKDGSQDFLLTQLRNTDDGSTTSSSVPEPGSAALALLAIGALGFSTRRAVKRS